MKRVQSVFLFIVVTVMMLSGCLDDDGTITGTTHYTTVADVDVAGSGTSRIGTFSLEDGIGSITINDKDVSAMAYWVTEWADYGYILFHVIAPEADTLNVLYLYGQTGNVPYIYHENYTLAMEYETSYGSLTGGGGYTTGAPELTTLERAPEDVSLVEGVQIAGDSVSYYGGTAGWLVWEQVTYSLYPFEYVDCGDCGSGSEDGWYELHSILEDADGRLCFCILYLMQSRTNQIQIGYPICLDPVEPLEAVYVDAQWTLDEDEARAFLPLRAKPASQGKTLWPCPPLP